MRLRSFSALPAVALSLCLVLTGCVASEPEPVSSAPSPVTSGPTSTPTIQPIEWYVPESRYELSCDQLIDGELAEAAFTVPVSAVDPLVTAASVGTAVPRKTSILSVGGSVCEWSNGAPYNDQYGRNPEYGGVSISVTPRPDGGWSSTAAEYGMPADQRDCVSYVYICFMSAAAGDAWVTLEAQDVEGGSVDPAAVDALFDSTVAAVIAAGDAAANIVPLRDRPELPTDCTAYLATSTVQSLTGLDASEPFAGGGGGWSDWAEARQAARNEPCYWSVNDIETAAAVSMIRDGRWAFERASAAPSFRPVALSGLDSADAAGIRCEVDYGGYCAVDIALGPDWISVTGPDESAAIALAEATIAQLAS